MPPISSPGPRSNGSAPASPLERVIRIFSVLTMLMTVPQVLAIWVDRTSAGVSVVSWAAYLCSACLWLGYGLRKRDPTIYVACIGWILLDVAIVVGALLYR